ncbi:prolipoprotein diacylglyceryl transferase [Desulfoluna spongiiphila]|uniref:Phosphatidylglycerol--prolipoprotein diacylglyceryl transferase n=1 Tax=Desulfoluna spongiiphila TaxID=419481 RepID=A0A1G5IQK5_9BACT|nr:prolipoprotein diacylglyceryl transferase [Desulfoluna spongiiphila]SCY78030.1 prolipoprotein diacylglyceryl transferase [Desulfoluna spongiiphila]
MTHPVWNIRPELFSLGPLTVRWYGLLFAGAFLTGFFYTERRTRRAGIAVNTDALLLFLMVGTLFGARLAHCFFYEPGYFAAHPLEILMVWKGGLASHGGLLGFLLSLWLFTRREGAPFFGLLDILTVPAAFGGALVRLGNFFNSEIVGHPTDVPWAVVFARVDSLPRHPVQLYESLVCLVACGILYGCDRTGASRGRGILSGVFLVVIFSSRIFLENVKNRQAPWAAGFPLTMGQVLSLPMVLAGLYLLVSGICRLGASNPSA